jgi:uncharacterized protein (TIGR02996 family)
MSPYERALLAAVAASPADDGPRLVYADYLDETGRPERAELIRVQCATPADAAHADRLTARADELLQAHGAGWVGLGPTAVATWDRGFPAAVELHLDDFRNLADDLPDLLPWPRLTVTHVAADLLGFLTSPALGCVTGLRAFDAAISAVPFTGAVLDEVEPFLDAARARMAGIELLDLSGCRVTDSLIEVVLPPAAFPALADLDLSNNWLTDAGVVALLAAGVPQRVRRLSLSGNNLSDQSAFELADRLGRAARLEVLDLRDTDISADGRRALAARLGARVVG